MPPEGEWVGIEWRTYIILGSVAALWRCEIVGMYEPSESSRDVTSELGFARMTLDDLVSVGLPVYNGERYLRQAIESVLGQTHGNLELIISDNASTDSTPSICEEYAQIDSRVRFYSQDHNVGAAQNFNFVAEKARGPYFKWMAHDDICRPRFLEACLETLRTDSTVVVAYPTSVEIDASGREVQIRDAGLGLDVDDPAERFRRTMGRAHKNWMLFGLMRAGVLEKTGRHGSYPAADRVLMSEMALHGKLREVPEPLHLHREHGERYVHTHRTTEAMMSWHDPSKASEYSLPTWLRLSGYARAILRSPIPLSKKIACQVWMIRWTVDMRFQLMGDLKPWVNRLRPAALTPDSIRQLISRAKARTKPAERSRYYDNPQQYWEQRHRKTESSLEGVGLQGLGSEGNARDYEEKWLSIRPILERLKSEGCRDLLDAGCGIGWFSERAARMGFQVEGMDFSPAAIESAGINVVPDIRWHLGELSTFAPGRLYDMVMCIDVLFHVADDGIWQRSVENLARLARRAGYLLIQEELVQCEEGTGDTAILHVHRRTMERYEAVLAGWDLVEHKVYELPAQGTKKDLLLFRSPSGRGVNRNW